MVVLLTSVCEKGYRLSALSYEVHSIYHFTIFIKAVLQPIAQMTVRDFAKPYLHYMLGCILINQSKDIQINLSLP